MTLNELKTIIVSTVWFSRIGEPDYENRAGFVRLSNLEEWRDITGFLPNEPLPSLFDQGMERLPTGHDEDDPIHGHKLEERVESLGKKREFTQQSLEVYQITLKALRPFDGHPLLKVGPRDFSGGARGAALFAVRRAAYEVLVKEPGFWCDLMKVFQSGHWPFGIMPDKRIVVL